MSNAPYNPLDKRHLGESIAAALLGRDVVRLSALKPFVGAGIYALYYTGRWPLYEPLASVNRDGRFAVPIYVGKANPQGSRKGGLAWDSPPGRALFNRLRNHAKNVEQAINLDVNDFHCRHLTVDDVWIPLGESLLIQRSKPLWNLVLEGFGNNTTGGRRETQQRSPWDVLHPGRPWAERLAPCSRKRADLERVVREHLSATIPPASH
jgi:hypothetical protein